MQLYYIRFALCFLFSRRTKNNNNILVVGVSLSVLDWLSWVSEHAPSLGRAHYDWFKRETYMCLATHEEHGKFIKYQVSWVEDTISIKKIIIFYCAAPTPQRRKAGEKNTKSEWYVQHFCINLVYDATTKEKTRADTMDMRSSDKKNRNGVLHWQSGPSLTIKETDADSFFQFDIPNDAKFRGWRRMVGAAWTVSGKASVDVFYVEADSKHEIHQAFEREKEKENSGNVKASAVVLDVLHGLNFGLDARLRKEYKNKNKTDVKSHCGHRAVVVKGRTGSATSFGKKPKIDIQIEVALEYINEQRTGISATIVEYLCQKDNAKVVVVVVAMLATLLAFIWSPNEDQINGFSWRLFGEKGCLYGKDKTSGCGGANIRSATPELYLWPSYGSSD